jgi:hypothetical protein
MKALVSFLLLVPLCFASAVFADNGDRKSQQNLFELDPVYTNNARNAQRVTVNLTYDNFKNVRIEEADEFDGYTTTAEVIVPFGADKSWEVRLEVPFYTKGDAHSRKFDRNIDIDGNGGVFDFATLIVQKELSHADKCPVNSSVYLGYGQRTDYLDTSIVDRYNHRGQVIPIGVNIDNARPDQDLRLQSTLEVRFYYDTDDLHPKDDGSSTFQLVNLSGAAVYNADGYFKPAFEVLYSTDLGDRHIVQAIPELIIPLGDRIEIKGAYAYGYSDGEGTTQTATVRTTFRF